MLFSSVVVWRKSRKSASFGASGLPEASGIRLNSYHPVLATSTIVLPPLSL